MSDTQFNNPPSFIPQSKKIFFFLKIKSFFYLIRQDTDKKFLKFFIKKPFFYTFNLLKSYFKKNTLSENENFYLFNLKNSEALRKEILNTNTLFIYGLSFCMRPLDCHKKRFSTDCTYNFKRPACKQCLIGKCKKETNKRDIFLIIMDIKSISQTLLEIMEKNPSKEIVFVIAACFFSINLFKDLANMIKIKGLALKLDGRVCINYKSFLFAEKGIKPGFTSLYFNSQNIILKILKARKNFKPMIKKKLENLI